MLYTGFEVAFFAQWLGEGQRTAVVVGLVGVGLALVHGQKVPGGFCAKIHWWKCKVPSRCSSPKLPLALAIKCAAFSPETQSVGKACVAFKRLPGRGIIARCPKF
jgi:hypothetical protein